MIDPEHAKLMELMTAAVGGESKGLTVTMWKAAPKRPAGYPEGLPFVANAAASVTLSGDGKNAAVTGGVLKTPQASLTSSYRRVRPRVGNARRAPGLLT